MTHPPQNSHKTPGSGGIVRYNSDVDDALGSGDPHPRETQNQEKALKPVPATSVEPVKGDHPPHQANRHHEEEVLGQTDPAKAHR